MSRSLGAAAVIVVELQPHRREAALAFGATHAVAPAELPSVSKELTGGHGVDAAIELTGSNSAFETAWPLVRLGGTLVLVGAVFPCPPVGLALEQIVRRNLTLRGIHNYAPHHLQAAVQFLAAHHQTYPLAKRYPAGIRWPKPKPPSKTPAIPPTSASASACPAQK